MSEFCDAVDTQTLRVPGAEPIRCGLAPGHDGPHGWEFVPASRLYEAQQELQRLREDYTRLAENAIIERAAAYLDGRASVAAEALGPTVRPWGARMPKPTEPPAPEGMVQVLMTEEMARRFEAACLRDNTVRYTHLVGPLLFSEDDLPTYIVGVGVPSDAR